jgi:hypothetical protein
MIKDNNNRFSNKIWREFHVDPRARANMIEWQEAIVNTMKIMPIVCK